MAEIKKSYNSVGEQIYLQTHEKAVVDNNGTTAETKFQMITDLVNQKQMEVGAVPSDLTPTEGSTNWVTSGGIKSAIDASLVDAGNLDLSAETRTVDMFKSGGINYETGAWINSNNLIISDYIPVNGVKFGLAFESDATLGGIYVIMYNSGNIVGAVEYESGDEVVIIGFDSIRIRVYSSTAWTSATIASTSATMTYYIHSIAQGVEDNETAIANINEDVFDGKTKIDLSSYYGKNGYPAQIYWLLYSGGEKFVRTHISIAVTSGQIYQIHCNSTNGSVWMFLTADDTVTTNEQAASMVDGTQRMSGVAGEIATVVIPEGCNYLAISKTLYTSNDYYPSAIYRINEPNANVKDVDSDGLLLADDKGHVVAQFANGHVKTKYFDSSASFPLESKSVENVELDYVKSIQQTMKVLTIEEQEMIPTSGVCITAYNGHLYCSINGTKYEINLTAVE